MLDKLRHFTHGTLAGLSVIKCNTSTTIDRLFDHPSICTKVKVLRHFILNLNHFLPFVPIKPVLGRISL